MACGSGLRLLTLEHKYDHKIIATPTCRKWRTSKSEKYFFASLRPRVIRSRYHAPVLYPPISRHNINQIYYGGKFFNVDTVSLSHRLRFRCLDVSPDVDK